MARASGLIAVMILPSQKATLTVSRGKESEAKGRERGAAATHREPLRTHSRSGLALSRRHQGHCNEIEGERERARERGVEG